MAQELLWLYLYSYYISFYRTSRYFYIVLSRCVWELSIHAKCETSPHTNSYNILVHHVTLHQISAYYVKIEYCILYCILHLTLLFPCLIAILIKEEVMWPFSKNYFYWSEEPALQRLTKYEQAIQLSRFSEIIFSFSYIWQVNPVLRQHVASYLTRSNQMGWQNLWFYNWKYIYWPSPWLVSVAFVKCKYLITVNRTAGDVSLLQRKCQDVPYCDRRLW